MPDRDIFTKLKPYCRLAASSLIAAARGESLDLLPVAGALDKCLEGGVASLPRMLQCIAALRGDERQSSFQDDSFHEAVRCTLKEQHSEGRRDWKDELLFKEVIREWDDKKTASDMRLVLRRFLMRTLNREIIDARGGIDEQLSKEGAPCDRDMLETMLTPLLETAAQDLLHRPHFERLRLAAKFRHPVDLYNENLLRLKGAA